MPKGDSWFVVKHILNIFVKGIYYLFILVPAAETLFTKKIFFNIINWSQNWTILPKSISLREIQVTTAPEDIFKFYFHQKLTKTALFNIFSDVLKLKG